MRLFEIELTDEYNNQIVQFLTDLGIVAIAEKPYKTISISRDSMVQAIGGGEDESYKQVLSMIREYMPDNLYIAWVSKDDDNYYLEVNKR